MEVIVSGRSQRAENMRERLRKKPAVMQGNHVKVSFSEMYLGIRVSELGFRDTLDQTARCLNREGQTLYQLLHPLQEGIPKSHCVQHRSSQT